MLVDPKTTEISVQYCRQVKEERKKDVTKLIGLQSKHWL